MQDRSRALTISAALLLLVAGASVLKSQAAPPAAVAPAASQNASPMVEHTRRHERLPDSLPPGTSVDVAGPLGKPVTVFVPHAVKGTRPVDLVIHFHGAAFVPARSVAALHGNVVSATVSIGSGSGVYDRAFNDPAAFDTLLSSIARVVAKTLGRDSVRTGRIVLSGFSAGHGAVRAILRDSAHASRVHAVLLMDGLHTSYVPEGVVLDKGGTLDEGNLRSLTAFARAAASGHKRMLITHSEIFPGTFASTTETTDWIVATLGLERRPVLRWGPRGLQQLSEVHKGHLEIRGFAGNAAPDHIDHFHAMPELLASLMTGR